MGLEDFVVSMDAPISGGSSSGGDGLIASATPMKDKLFQARDQMDVGEALFCSIDGPA